MHVGEGIQAREERWKIKQSGTRRHMEELGAGDGQHKNLLEQGHMDGGGQIIVVRGV